MSQNHFYSRIEIGQKKLGINFTNMHIGTPITRWSIKLYNFKDKYEEDDFEAKVL